MAASCTNSQSGSVAALCRSSLYQRIAGEGYKKNVAEIKFFRPDSWQGEYDENQSRDVK